MRLAFEQVGTGPVVVLLHGFPLDRTMWVSQLAALGSRYRVIVPDLRGHGQSPAPEGVYTMEEMAGDVLELLDALKVTEPIVLGGLSMGGYVALALAAGHAERMRGLLLIDRRSSADAPEAARLREETAQQVEAAGTAEAVVAAMLPKLFSAATRERRPDLIARTQAQMLKTSARAVSGALRGMAARADRTSDLGRIQLPTLVVVGSDDAITPPAEAQRMAQALPNARLVEIADAGHLAPLENPVAVNAAVLEFLQLRS